MTAGANTKRMKLRYAGICRECHVDLPQGALAVYDRTAKNVICVDCFDAYGGESVSLAAPEVTTGSTELPFLEEPVPVELGTAGASARREYVRRTAKREQRIRARHPKLGGLILALSEEPQSTTAWRTGAKGEEALGKLLDRLAPHGVRTLHDRRIPGSRANIDHIVVSSAGVFVLDAKRYKGRPSLKIEGGILRPRTETLMVGTRTCTPLVEGMVKQLTLVKAVLTKAGLGDLALAGMLVFVEADWPLFGGEFSTQRVNVVWPKKAVDHITKPGELTAVAVDGLTRLLAQAFPAA